MRLWGGEWILSGKLHTQPLRVMVSALEVIRVERGGKRIGIQTVCD